MFQPKHKPLSEIDVVSAREGLKAELCFDGICKEDIPCYNCSMITKWFGPHDDVDSEIEEKE